MKKSIVKTLLLLAISHASHGMISRILPQLKLKSAIAIQARLSSFTFADWELYSLYKVLGLS